MSKLNDAEGEAAETQTWLEYAVRCSYLDRGKAKHLFLEYDEMLAMLVSMANRSHQWVMKDHRK